MLPPGMQRMLTKKLTGMLLDSPLFVGAVKRGHSVISEFSEGLKEGMLTGPPPEAREQAARAQAQSTPSASTSAPASDRWQAAQARAAPHDFERPRSPPNDRSSAQRRPHEETRPRQPPKDDRIESNNSELQRMLEELRRGRPPSS